RYSAGEFTKVNETSGQTITAITTDSSGSVFMASDRGRVYESSTSNTRELLNRPLESSDRDHPGPLPITSINVANGRIFIGTLSRGVLEIANGAVKETQMKPVAFFVNALERD